MIHTKLKSPFLFLFRPVDIQTSDAGPGVSSHEQMTQIRMAEYFMINYLDIQCRFHYAPGDSKSHMVEQVMRSLNESSGDGRTITVSSASFIDDDGQFKMTELNNDELQRVQNEEAKIAKGVQKKSQKDSRENNAWEHPFMLSIRSMSNTVISFLMNCKWQSVQMLTLHLILKSALGRPTKSL